MENQILKILTNHQGHYISGQDISEKLHVSRMTISTYIKGLKEKGYQIETSTKKGYCLTQNNDIIFKGDIPKELSNEIFDLNVNEEIHKNIYKGDFWYLEKPLDEAHEYHKESGFTYNVKKFSELKNSEVIKFFYINENEKLIRNLENEINEKFGDRINLTLSLPICLEIMNKGISKGSAITDILLPKFGIKTEEVISFGDGLNDYEMLDVVGEGLLMGNCNPRLKELLPNNRVIGRNDENGVAEYLKKVFL